MYVGTYKLNFSFFKSQHLFFFSALFKRWNVLLFMIFGYICYYFFPHQFNWVRNYVVSFRICDDLFYHFYIAKNKNKKLVCYVHK